ncbi:flagellar hook protein FlgE [Oceanicoccus sp. KOV_DT_Chl]|uniref:flagellar hook protein FlgE n=1 Tax=Oceanicoccus sp. KOV_DT_Chl TaxID=1904639 RepID=UPI000C7BD4B5|nr:flagellar hook protein FlgE [Oceanicoccus sp. KOV_DT_Chl]
MTFNTALSGLRAANTDLEVTGNNIANASTTGFKRSRAEFGDVYANSLVGGGSNSAGSGVLVNAIAQQFDQGNVSFTDNSLDLAINGTGFFIVAEESGATAFTRAGYFGLNEEGYITNNSGSRLQGFLPTGSGTGVGGTPDDLQVAVSDLAPSPTTEVDLLFNLDARNDPPVISTFDPNDADTFNSSTSLTIFDSRGQSHVLSTYYVKSDTDNAWRMYAYIPDENGNLQNVLNNGGTLAAADLATATTNNTVAQATAVLTADAATQTTTVDGLAATAAANAAAAAVPTPFVAGDVAALETELEALVVAANTALTAAVATGNAALTAAATTARDEAVNAEAFAEAARIAGPGAGEADVDNAAASALLAATASANALALAATLDSTAQTAAANTASALVRATNIASQVHYDLVFATDGTLQSSIPDVLTIDNWNPAGANQSSTDGSTTATTGNSDFVVDIGTSTQFGSNFAVSSVDQDGYATGQLSGLEINSTGEIFARYTNGEALILGQVAMASFANEQGLSALGETSWAQSFESGEPVVGAPLTSTLGAIQSGALEESNVDLSEELVRLIVAQRNFQANAKTIETADTVTQAIINIR